MAFASGFVVRVAQILCKFPPELHPRTCITGSNPRAGNNIVACSKTTRARGQIIEMWWICCLIMAYLAILVRCEPVTIDIRVVNSEGGYTTRTFTHEPEQNPVSGLSLDASIDSFCTSVSVPLESCRASILSEYVRLTSSTEIAPWLNHLTVLQRFASDIVADACRDHTSDSQCIARSTEAIRSVKLYHAFSAIRTLFEEIEKNGLVPLPEQWRRSVEGHTFLFKDKVHTMQELADDPRVESVCEVGFNMGHSTVNWLTANPNLSVLAFDLTRQLYTSAAVNALGVLFPNRHVTLVTGDSGLSIPNFAHLVNGAVKCNIIFIDGTHTAEGALLDIQHMRAFVNDSYHRVIIDDATAPGVAQAWRQAVDTGLLKLHSLVPANQTLCLQAEQIKTGPYAGAYSFTRQSVETCVFQESSDYVQDALMIGEYVLT